MLAPSPYALGEVQPLDPAAPDPVRAPRNRMPTWSRAPSCRAWKDDQLPAGLPPLLDEGRRLPARRGVGIQDAQAGRAHWPAPCDTAGPAAAVAWSLMTGARRGEFLDLRCRASDPGTETVRGFQPKTGKALAQLPTPEGVALFDSLTAGNPQEQVFLRADGRPWGQRRGDQAHRRGRRGGQAEGREFKNCPGGFGTSTKPTCVRTPGSVWSSNWPWNTLQGRQAAAVPWGTRQLARETERKTDPRGGPVSSFLGSWRRARAIRHGYQLTLTALQAAFTALVWVELAPYRSVEAAIVASRAPA